MRFLSATAISRFRSSASSNHLVGFLRSSSSAAAAASTATDAFLSHPASSYGGGGDGKQRWRLFSLPRVLLPIALAASASFLSLDLRHSYGLCDPLLDQQYGGMERTEIGKEIPKVFFDELRNILQDGMTVDYDERYFHGKPQNSFHKSVNVPDVVVYPRSQDDVQKIIIACNKYKVPIVPYGGATSIEGHTLAPNGGVCIDMSMMKVCAYFLDINAGNDDNATCLKHAHSAQCRALEILTQNVLGFLDAIICILESFAHPGLALLK